MADFILSAFADEAAGSLEEQIKALEEENISLIELRGVNGKNCADLTESEAKEIAEIMAELEVSFPSRCKMQRNRADSQKSGVFFHSFWCRRCQISL